MLILQPVEARGHGVQCLLPRDLFEALRSPHERCGQPLRAVHEVEAIAPFHAERTVVDGGAGGWSGTDYLIVSDFEVDAATAAAEGTGRGHFLRSCTCVLPPLLHQCACWAYCHAGAAEGTLRIVQRQIVEGGGSRSKSAMDVIDRSLDHKLVVHAYALGAEYALAEVSLDKGVDLFDDSGLWYPLVVHKPDPGLRGNPAQIAVVALVADHAGVRMGGKHQLDDGLAAVLHLRRSGVDHHARLYRGHARG